MFGKNTKHLQPALISAASELPEKQLKRLKASWAGTFYREFFCRINEEIFSVLYSDEPSRPNVPVNVLVGLEALKAGFGWSDEELYENYCYNLQVRYALGYRHLGEGYFDLRTLYYFRERLSQHMQETGRNLLDEAFEQVTDEQLAAFALWTGKQRMDSTQVASNIRQLGRVQLLVAVLQRVQQMLSAADRERYAEAFEPYVKGHVGQYVYRLQREEIGAHLQQIGAFMQRLLVDICPARPGKRDPRHHLRFTQAKVQAAARRRRSLKHPFPAGKLPVRGQFRMACLLIGSAAVANIRRIQRYLEAKKKGQKQLESTKSGPSSIPQAARDLFEGLIGTVLQSQASPDWAFGAGLSC